MDDDNKTFEGWAILELMGHRRLAGYVTEVQIAGHGFVRLDIPETTVDGHTYPPATQFYSPGSVYALTPATEETARLVRSRPMPVQSWEIPRPRALEPVPAGIDERLDELYDEHEERDELMEDEERDLF